MYAALTLVILSYDVIICEGTLIIFLLDIFWWISCIVVGFLSTVYHHPLFWSPYRLEAKPLVSIKVLCHLIIWNFILSLQFNQYITLIYLTRIYQGEGKNNNMIMLIDSPFFPLLSYLRYQRRNNYLPNRIIDNFLRILQFKKIWDLN